MNTARKMRRQHLIPGILTLAAFAAADAPAQEKAIIPRWPEGVPGAIPNGGPERALDAGRIENIHLPSLTAYPAPENLQNGTAVVICPGGGYVRLAFEYEGRAVAWMTARRLLK